MIILRLLNSTRDNDCTPAAATVPNIKIPAPPKTGCGMMEISVANLGKRLITIMMIPPMIATLREALRVNGINPAFWLNVAAGPEPMNGAMN